MQVQLAGADGQLDVPQSVPVEQQLETAPATSRDIPVNIASEKIRFIMLADLLF